MQQRTWHIVTDNHPMLRFAAKLHWRCGFWLRVKKRKCTPFGKRFVFWFMKMNCGSKGNLMCLNFRWCGQVSS